MPSVSHTWNSLKISRVWAKMHRPKDIAIITDYSWLCGSDASLEQMNPPSEMGLFHTGSLSG